MKIMGVADTAGCLLRQEIVTGQLLPGTKLNEIQLSERYGVSRPPLREAFRKLEYEKLVNTIPRRGTFVTEISFEDCREVYYTRQIIESAAVDLIAENENPTFTRLNESIDHLEEFKVPRNSDPRELTNYYEGIACFHRDLVELAGNRWLIHCYQSIASTLGRYQLIYLKDSDAGKPVIKDHQAVLQYMKDGQFEKAKQKLAEHIACVLNKMLNNL